MLPTHTGGGDAGAPVSVGFHCHVAQRCPDKGAQKLPEVVQLNTQTRAH